MGQLGFPEEERMICAPIIAQSAVQMLNGMNQAKMDGADVVEINLDCIYSFETWRDDLKLLLENKPIPVVVLCRTSWEGDDELKQLQALLLAKDLGADYIDLDLKVPVVAYCSGERGLISQLLNFKYGGVFVYGSIEGCDIPGVPNIYSLRQAYGVKNIDRGTRVFGLISKPVRHSKGPILHNPAFRHVGYNGIYVPMLVDDLKEFFDVYSTPDFAGFSVGIPYKEAIIDFCDEVHPLAKSIGAVNTIIRRPDDGKLVGYNTDCEAAISAIEDALKESDGLHSSPLNGKLFVLVGAGGAGRALAFGAKTRGARIVVFDIDFERAKSLADAVSGEARPFEDLINFKPEKGAILANATPLGMHPYNVDRTPVPEERLRDYKLVFDAVYSPRKTRLLKEAEAAGAITVSGVEMFLRQAAAQFSLFTTLKAPEEFMRRIILEKF